MALRVLNRTFYMVSFIHHCINDYLSHLTNVNFTLLMRIKVNADFSVFTALIALLLLVKGMDGYAKSILDQKQEVAIKSELIDLDQQDLQELEVRFYAEGKYDSLILILQQARKISRNSAPANMGRIYISLANAFYYKGDYDSLQFWIQKAEKLISQDNPIYGDYLYVNALKSSFNGDYVSSIENTFKALEFFEAQNNNFKMALAYGSLAFDYRNLSDVINERAYLEKAIAINKANNFANNLIQNLNNLGSSYEEEGLLDEALSYYDSAFTVLQDYVFSPRLMAQNLTNRANIFENLEDYGKSIDLLNQALEICEQNNIAYGIMLLNMNLGELYRVTQNFDQSEHKLLLAIDKAKEMKLAKELSLSYQRLAWLYRDMGDFKAAYNNDQRYRAINDSLVNETVRTNANELKEKYETEKREKEIISLSKNRLEQRFVIVLLAVLLLIFIFIALLWYARQRNLRSKYQFIEKLNQTKEETLRKREADLLSETLEKAELRAKITELIQNIKKGDSAANVAAKLKSIEENNNPSESLIHKFKILNPKFIESLVLAYPSLSKGEVDFCLLLKMNLTNREIGQVLQITDQSVRTKKYRIQKKLGLKEDKDLYQVIHEVAQ